MHPAKPLKEETDSPSLVPGTVVTERNFGLAEVSGPRKDRVLKLSIHNSKGEQLWIKEFKANDLK